jgi:serine/threonine-protein kinase RsbW
MSEGITNAYVHGNQKNPEAMITLSLYIGENSLKILIEDSAILPIKDTVNRDIEIVDPMAVSGRGMFLIKKITDHAYYEYDPKGINRLVMICEYANKQTKISI